MGFWTLFQVASMPILQVLIISLLGAFMATEYSNLLSVDTRKSLNKVVFMVFTPSLMFASLAQTVTLQDIIEWWFMPINIGLTFLFGGILGWILVKILKPMPYLEGIIIASCSAGNLGNLLLIIVPAVCDENGSPFGDDRSACRTTGLSYASFSMAFGGFFIWTYTYHLIRSSSGKFEALKAVEESSMTPNKDLEANGKTRLLKGGDIQEHIPISVSPTKSIEVTENQVIVAQESERELSKGNLSIWNKVYGLLHQIGEELLAPPSLAAIIGFIFGAISWLRNLIIGESAPLRVIQDSIKLLGDGTIPCITLILGGNLTQGIRSVAVKPMVIIGVICVRYILLPVIGIWVVKAAANFGFLPPDPLYQYVLMIQFTLPPAMNIGTMTQLIGVAQEECSILFLFTYLASTLALTFWSTVYMWIL